MRPDRGGRERCGEGGPPAAAHAAGVGAAAEDGPLAGVWVNGGAESFLLVYK